MPNLRDIKKRIASVKNTGKITKAMKMVSAAKLRKTQASMMAARPYADKIREILTNISTGVEETSHPLLSKHSTGTIEVIVITSDRGLCGAFNTNVINKAVKFIKNEQSHGVEVSISTIGKKARDFFTRRGYNVRRSWIDNVSAASIFNASREVTNDIISMYTDKIIDAAFIAFSEFKSVILQTPTIMDILPIEKIEGHEEGVKIDFIFEPNELEILNDILPKYIETQIFHCILESRTSEEAARMVAMENATKNTKELIEKLTLQYNKARQAAITSELMDIVGGAAAIG